MFPSQRILSFGLIFLVHFANASEAADNLQNEVGNQGLYAGSAFGHEESQVLPNVDFTNGKISDPRIVLLSSDAYTELAKHREAIYTKRNKLKSDIEKTKAEIKIASEAHDLAREKKLHREVKEMNEALRVLKSEYSESQKYRPVASNDWFLMDDSQKDVNCGKEERPVTKPPSFDLRVYGCVNQRGQLTRYKLSNNDATLSSADYQRDSSGKLQKIEFRSDEKLYRTELKNSTNTAADLSILESVVSGDIVSRCEYYHRPKVDKSESRARNQKVEVSK
jgi:hypothetical protein